jgi:ApbE superfamily uncharacterized protein (UPF0280 family)
MKEARHTRDPVSYVKRTYRVLAEQSGLVSTYVRIKETDLHILAQSDVTKTGGELAARYRLQVEQYIGNHPEFRTSLTPLPVDDLAPPIIRDMLMAGQSAGVGPMAAVAGAISHYVGKGLIEAGQEEVVVENGGDIYLVRLEPSTVGVFAGQSPLSNRVGLLIDPADMPLGICTSSGTVGHSLSFGTADSVTVLASFTPLADAAATRLGNEVQNERQPGAAVERALAVAENLSGIMGCVVICGESFGAVGSVELVPLS